MSDARRDRDGRAVRAGQVRTLAGRRPPRVRASEEHSAAMGALLAKAPGVLDSKGDAPSRTTVDRAAETLRCSRWSSRRARASSLDGGSRASARRADWDLPSARRPVEIPSPRSQPGAVRAQGRPGRARARAFGAIACRQKGRRAVRALPGSGVRERAAARPIWDTRRLAVAGLVPALLIAACSGSGSHQNQARPQHRQPPARRRPRPRHPRRRCARATSA